MHFILTYNTVDRFNDRKMRFRKEHLELVREYYDTGILIMGGALLEPNDVAVLIFKCESPREVEQFITSDPYYKNGLINSFDIRPWSVAIGGKSAPN
ncbi:MAG: hypothetical protein KJP00_01255 [Bacteroidia bacterium]|nr:hypothetical protein [Bacteroidia bacterium]